MNHFKYLRLPDLITFIGLFAVIASTFFAWKGYFLIAYLLIIGQIVADFFDGKVARKMKRENDLGIHLDNFSDFYTIVNDVLLGIFIGISHFSMYLVFPLFIAAGALRLSTFTILKNTDPKTYHGIPTTAASFIIASFLILNWKFFNLQMDYWLILYLLLAFLMVSPLKIKKW